MTGTTTPGRLRRRVAMACALMLIGAGATVWLGPWRQAWPSDLGTRLFDGREPLAGTLSGHATPLPPEAARCIQCHAGPTTTASPISAQPLPGPVLDRHHLRNALPRRGGPPVAYELATFCRAVRDGLDPAHVVLPRAMPRFAIDDARCKALWTHLTRNHP